MDGSSDSQPQGLAYWRDAFVENEQRYNFSEFQILVLNENRFMQSLLAQMLRGFGASMVVCVRDTDMAFQELAARPFDLILVDWMVTPLDGRGFVRKIRASREKALRVIPVIMITGHSEQFRVEAARDAGANEFLTLPLAPMTLFDRIVSLIDHPRPFIRTRTFFGPDRRRRRGDDHHGPWRRSSDPLYTGDAPGSAGQDGAGEEGAAPAGPAEDPEEAPAAAPQQAEAVP